MKPTLGLDLDGVVVDFERMWMTKWNAEHGTSFTPGMVDRWDWRQGNADMNGESFWKWARKVRLWSGDVPTYPGELEAARKLHRHWSVVILSSKPEWSRRDVTRWLESSGIHYQGVIYTGAKVPKWQFRMQAYVDDSPRNLKDLIYYQLTSTVYRMVRNWNEPMRRVHDIKSLEELL